MSAGRRGRLRGAVPAARGQSPEAGLRVARGPRGGRGREAGSVPRGVPEPRSDERRSRVLELAPPQPRVGGPGRVPARLPASRGDRRPAGSRRVRGGARRPGSTGRVAGGAAGAAGGRPRGGRAALLPGPLGVGDSPAPWLPAGDGEVAHLAWAQAARRVAGAGRTATVEGGPRCPLRRDWPPAWSGRWSRSGPGRAPGRNCARSSETRRRCRSGTGSGRGASRDASSWAERPPRPPRRSCRHHRSAKRRRCRSPSGRASRGPVSAAAGRLTLTVHRVTVLNEGTWLDVEVSGVVPGPGSSRGIGFEVTLRADGQVHAAAADLNRSSSNRRDDGRITVRTVAHLGPLRPDLAEVEVIVGGEQIG